MDLDIDEFAGLDDKARQKAIARRDLLDKKKGSGPSHAREQREEGLRPCSEEGCQGEGQGKGKGKAKKKDEGGAEVVPSSTTDGASEMPCAVKRKATLS